MPEAVAPGRYDTLVVGSGFAGAVIAERLASQCGQRVCVIDRRDHIGGNAHDYVDGHGVLCHRYGPHIFHTQSERVVEYLSQFTAWRAYEHRILASLDGQLLPIPINRETVCRLYGVALADEEDMRRFLAARAEPRARIETSEDVIVSRVGRDLYLKFFRGYTRKQWGLDPAELDASVCARIPIRLDTDGRCFTDAFQGIPAEGYTRMFERMLAHENIDVILGAEFNDVRNDLCYERLVYTGPLDRYYGCRFGELEYRSLRFELVNHPTPGGGLLQEAASINYPSEDVPYTRTTEYRHLTGQMHDSTTIAIEYPTAEGEPYYPISRAANRRLHGRYRRLAAAEPGVTFLGRLARYQYLNMDQVTAQALATFDRLRRSGLLGRPPRARSSFTIDTTTSLAAGEQAWSRHDAEPRHQP